MTDSSSGDLALLSRARRGDSDAFGTLVRDYQTSVFNVCYRLLGERREAEDMTQEAFVRAYQRLDTFDVARPFGPWIRRVAANLCLNHLHVSRPDLVSLDEDRDGAKDETTPEDSDPEVARDRGERSEALRAALLSLPPHYRGVIELRHYHAMSYSDIAGAMKVSVSDVKSHLFRARKLLATRLKQYDR